MTHMFSRTALVFVVLLTACLDDSFGSSVASDAAVVDTRQIRICPQPDACLDVDECNPEQYVTDDPDDSSYRTCMNLTVCASRGEWEATEPTDTSDRECKAHTEECDPDVEYEAERPTRTQDRLCKAFTVCNSEQYETQEPGDGVDRVCVPLTACVISEYIREPHTATTDRNCSKCQTGTFADTINTVECEPWQECVLPEVETYRGTIGYDRTCGATVRDCCEGHDQPGCSDPEITACVCDKYSWCCDDKWDETCAEIVRSGLCHPGVRECVCGTLGETECCEVTWGPRCDELAASPCGAGPICQ